MPSYTKLICDLFDRTSGAVTVSDANGESFTSDDLIKVGAFASKAPDPWLDLVTSTGDAIGLFIAGNPESVDPQPSFDVEGGMVYMIDGDPIAGQKEGLHICPLSLFLNGKGVADTDGLNMFTPDMLDIVTPGSQREITLMTGRRRDEAQGKWKEVSSTFGQFETMLQQHKEGQKDGPCFLQGQSASGARKAVAMISNHILGVDLDSGAPLADVMTTIQKFGLEAVIYTTHSHLKDTSVIKRDHFMKWADATEVEEDAVRDYLVQMKGTLPAIVEKLEIVNDAHHSEEGVVILVQHAPMPKFRAVFPLADPFVFAKRGGSQQDAISEWKERYAGFCTELGLFFDEKCVDPARLFYLPRHNKGDTFGSWLIVGEALDLDKFDRVKMKRGRNNKRSAVSQNAFTDAGVDDDDDYERDRYVTEAGFNVKGWAIKHAKRLEVQTLLEDVIGGDFIRDPRGNKAGVHVECPFEAEHSSFGGGGCFVVNASDNMEEGNDSGFSFVCVHNSCSGRDRLDYLRELIDQELISADDLKDKNYLLELEDDSVEDEYQEDESGEAPAPTPATRGRVDAQDAANREALAEDETEDFGDDEDTMLRAFNRRYAVIRTSGGVKILVEPRAPGEDVQFESQNDVALFEKNRILFVSEGKGKGSKKLEGFKLWLESEKRRTYRSVVFAPGQKVPADVYNLFRGWPFEPKEGDWSILRGHIYENICESNDTYFEWLMTWIAMLFQNPAAKPGSTVVITGEKGTGKSTLFDYINQLLGRCGITVSQRKQIVGQFNGHLATTLLMVCEEAFWAADPQAEGVLKDMITNKSVLIEKKGYDPIQSQNYTRLALISNNDWVVPASLKDERRFFVLRCSSAVRGNIDFFDGMRKQMEKEGGLEAMLHDLLHWPTPKGWGILFNPPVTSHLQLQQIESLSGVQKFMLELVKSGIYETHDDKVTPIELNTDHETMVYAVDMRAAVEDYVRYRFSSDKAKTSYDDISSVVTDWFGAREVKLDVDGSMNKKRTFIFPPLSEVRAKLKEAKGLDVETMSEEYVKSIKLR